MSAWGEVVTALVILVGLFGVVVQVLPGSLIVLGAVGVWGVVTGGPVGWGVLAVAAVAIGAAAVVKYLVAGRHMRRAEVPGSTLVWGAVAGVVGFFVIPVVGLFIGFVGAVYLAELARLHDRSAAWRATVVALQATGLTILIELAGALAATGAWVAGLVIA